MTLGQSSDVALVQSAYLAASGLFVLALMWMSSPKTARRGVRAGELGMLIAVCGTLIHSGVVQYDGIAIGILLGTLVGEQVIARHGLKAFEAADFGNIVAAACLSHDIGNPPFGHSGEDAIRHWAKDADYGSRRVGTLRGSQREDFLSFEGNAQGFRIVTRLQNPDNPGGLQLTAATLAAFTKYPRESCLGGSRYEGVSARKQGFTAADRESFETVAQEVGLIRRDSPYAIWCRHPLAFLVEAADDISYRVIDIEDGYRLGHFGYEEVTEAFLELLPDRSRQQTRMQGIREKKDRVEFLRAKVINEVILQTLACFMDNEAA
ncbi:MAG: NAD(P)(+) transhydrogenase (Re/Si-specific) subunit beta, partial [Novosphingobium sp.]